MHLIILVAVVALIVLLVTNLRPRAGSAASGDPAALTGTSVTEPVAFISRGKLFYQTPGAALREIQSPYVQGVMDRMERSRQLHGWKQGTAFGTNFARREMHGESNEISIQAVSAQFLSDDRLLYFLRDDSFGGLFEQNLSDGLERRLLHKQNLSLEDMRLNADATQMLCSQRAANGTANIVVMKPDGSGAREVTGGDTADSAPAWIPAQPDQFVFQCAGLARDKAGYAIAFGPASIQLADMTRDALTTVREDATRDFLQPRVGADGSLYFISRPYEQVRNEPSNALLDVLLFPFRLARAVFHYLNFFSMMYTRKPLTTASGPRMDADLKEILLKGKRIDAEAALRRGALVGGVPSLVPASWELVCRNRQGQERVIATHVASFDLAPDGAILFSNGNGVFAVRDGLPPQVLLRDQLIEDVVARQCVAPAEETPVA